MNRREVLRAGVSAGALALTGCLTEPDQYAFREGFESGVSEWDAAAAIGPEVELADFEWELGVTDTEAAEGTRSLRIWNEGDHDDGVTWGVHPVPVEPDRSYAISVSAQFWSESESFNTIRDAVMRLGPEPPEIETDFPQPGVNTTKLGQTPYGGLREPLWLTDGWHKYSFTWVTPKITTDTLYIAVGTSVIWEGDATHYVDDIRVEVAPD